MPAEIAVALLLVAAALFLVGMVSVWVYDRISTSWIVASVAWALAVTGLFAFIVTRG